MKLSVIKRSVFVVALLLTQAAGAWAQNGKDSPTTNSSTDTPRSLTQRFFYGGHIGMIFTDEQTRLSIAPMAGFHITPDWSAGLQLGIEYYTYDYLLNNQTATAKSYGIGGGLFTRYEAPVRFLQQFGSGIYAHAEYDYMHYSLHYNGNLPDSYNNRHSILAGAGGYIPISPRSRISITALWELWHSDSTPYSGTPIVRVGIVF
jgi:hypothetical protein